MKNQNSTMQEEKGFFSLLRVEGVYRVGKSFPNPIHEPVKLKTGNIASAGNTDNHDIVIAVC